MMRQSRPIIEQVSFKTKTKDDLILYSWASPKFEYYGTSNFIKIALREKMEREEREENNK